MKRKNSFFILILLGLLGGCGRSVEADLFVLEQNGQEIKQDIEQSEQKKWEMEQDGQQEEQGNLDVVCIFTEEEEEKLQEDAIRAAEGCMDFYKDVEVVTSKEDYSYIKIFTDEKRKMVVERLGEQGLIGVSDNDNMKNYSRIYEFYQDYCDGKEGMITVFKVDRDGEISALTFLYREGKMQSYHVRIGWKEGGIPKIRRVVVNDLAEIKLTEKGYFIYTNLVTKGYSNLREYFRVQPLSDECRRLTEKYLYGLSYVNYNMLVIDWDSRNVEEILMPCMFQDIYRVYTRENFRAEYGRIPAEICEEVMTTCFPISVEQLRNAYCYDFDSNSYKYEIILSKQFPPFGEVVDYKKNEDGTITLIVDGVWADYNSDCAFTNQIVIEPFEDGTWRYLSNSIEKRELEIPQIRDTDNTIDKTVIK